MDERKLGQRPGWLIAFSRLVLAIAILALSTTAPDDGPSGSLHYEIDDMSALAYVAVAGFALGLCVHDWWQSFRCRSLFLIIDFAAYLMIMLLMEPMLSGYFAASITMLTFLVLSLAVQWGWRQAAWVLLLLNVICVVMIGQMAWDGMPLLHSVLLRRQTYQFLISFFLLCAASWVQSPKPAFLLMPPGLNPADQFVHAIEYARLQLGSAKGGLCWVGQGDASCTTLVESSSKGNCNTGGFCSADFTNSLPGPAIFDLGRDRCVAKVNGSFVTTEMGSDECAFALRSGIEAGIFIPLAGAAGQGRLVLEMPPLAGVEILRFAADIGRQISQNLDGQTYFRLLEESSLEKVRQSIARDLHDNVAQTLAGTRFWLESLRSAAGRGEQVEDKLTQLSSLLMIEQSHVAETIDLLLNSTFQAQRDLTESLEILSKTLSMHWQIDIRLAKTSVPVELPVEMVHELRAIAREAISNAVRHGHASKIVMETGIGGGEVSLTISNDGKPFENPERRPRTIEDRVTNCDGTLEVQSTINETRLVIVIPIGTK